MLSLGSQQHLKSGMPADALGAVCSSSSFSETSISGFSSHLSMKAIEGCLSQGAMMIQYARG